MISVRWTIIRIGKNALKQSAKCSLQNLSVVFSTDCVANGTLLSVYHIVVLGHEDRYHSDGDVSQAVNQCLAV